MSLNKLKMLKDKRPLFRRIIDGACDLYNKMMIVYFISCLALAISVIGVPTVVAYIYLPEDIRTEIASIIGGILSLVVIPLLVNYIYRKQKRNDELLKINKPIYDEIFDIFIKLLVEIKSNEKNSKFEEQACPLKEFICANYCKMCCSFSVSLIWDIVGVYNECVRSVTTYNNVDIKVRKCIRKIRREIGERDTFYINQSIINLLCDK